MTTLVLTIIGNDRPGLVDSLARVVADHGGNWMESRMAHLGGKFAGILRVAVAAERADALVAALGKLDAEGLRVVGEADAVDVVPARFLPYRLELLGNDRPGIVREISHALAERSVNVEDFRTECLDAPMSGGQLFRATAQLRLPRDQDVEDLRRQLEQIAHDLMVDISLSEPSSDGPST